MPRGLSRSLSRANDRLMGAQTSIAGLKRTVTGSAGYNQITFTMSGMLVPVTDALAYAGLKLFDFPLARVYVTGGLASIQWAVTTARASTINDSASLTWGVGTATASATTLATTMQDIVPVTTKVLAAATTALNTVSTANVASPAFYDGTATAKDIYLNTAFATGTDIDGDGTLSATGKIVINVQMQGAL